jgi:hypothetical protein
MSTVATVLKSGQWLVKDLSPNRFLFGLASFALGLLMKEEMDERNDAMAVSIPDLAGGM